MQRNCDQCVTKRDGELGGFWWVASGVLLLFTCFPLWKMLLTKNRRKAGACEDDQE